MKQAKNALVLQSILAIGAIWGFIALYRMGYIPSGLDVFIFAMIMVSAVYAFVTHMPTIGHDRLRRLTPCKRKHTCRSLLGAIVVHPGHLVQNSHARPSSVCLSGRGIKHRDGVGVLET